MASHFRKIVVRAPNWIGDAILALPAIHSLSRNFPYAEIWVAGRDWVKDLFLSLDYVHGIVSLPSPSGLRGIREAVRTIKSHNFDAGLLLPNSFASALLFTIARIPHRWGYARDGRRLFLTKRVLLDKNSRPVPQSQYYLNLISGLGFQAYPGEAHLEITKEDRQKAAAQLETLGIKLKNPLVILNPGGFYGPAKRWPVAKFAELADILQARKKADILIIGAKDEIGMAEEIASRTKNPPFIMSGKTTLPQLAGILHHARLFVSNDSGPMHMATALKVPVVAIFGPTDPALTGPRQQPSAVVKKAVDCWPCRHRECPADHKCMVYITAEEVYRACEQFLK